MARPTLYSHRKFRCLARALGSRALAAGSLDLVWNAAYQDGDPLIGGAEDVEEVADWKGDPGRLAEALATAGFLDVTERGFEVHDLFDHAPDYVRRRMKRSEWRRENGKELSEIRAEAGRKGGHQAALNRQHVASNRLASDQPLAATPTPTPAPAPAPAPLKQDPVPTERSRPAPRRAAPKETKATKEPAKRYHPKTAFPPGSPALAELKETFRGFPNVEAAIVQLDAEHRKRRPSGEAFTSVDRWTRDRLVQLEARLPKNHRPLVVPASKRPEAPRSWEENLIIDDPEIRELRNAAHERQSRPCPICRTVDTLVLLVRTDDFTGRAFVRQMLCPECYEKRKKEEPCKSNA